MYQNQSLMHYGVLGMKWGHRKARIDRARESYSKADTRSEVRAAKKELTAAKKEYKKETSLNRHQKNVRLGAAIAASILTTPVGGIAVAALMTSHYRGYNDERRD